MISPDLSTIRAARDLLRKYFGATPLKPAPSLSRVGSEVYLKIETGLPTGSFKPRGALHALATNLARRKIEEVTASSTGNHGAAVAFAAKTLGVRATIFLPENANLVKRKKIQNLGARIVETGSADLAEAFERAKEYSAKDGIYFLNDATDPDLPAGPATIGLEIVEQLGEISAVFVPMGDTALIRGVAAAIKQLAPQVKVIGVQAAQAPSYCLSWREGKAVPTESCDTCADGLATRTPDAENVATIRQLVDDVALVSEERMVEAIRQLYLREGVVAEPAGAAATAAWLDGLAASGNVVLLVTGGNVSDAVRERAGI
ncbi:MAG TPA: pyridoxal-phosphate dependent enzyme [Candidatus Sulfotelmatobacter sp.]|jgi:threonine dehydratase|nr:pyridoxal-phosphate dependent enzyme [Candidatus Sulfotelmatobacter sp.]